MSGAESFRELDGRSFTPEKVAERITGFVEQGLARARRDGKSELEVEELRQQALAGINQGFKEARGILKDMNLLSDEMAATIDRTQFGVNYGIDWGFPKNVRLLIQVEAVKQ